MDFRSGPRLNELSPMPMSWAARWTSAVTAWWTFAAVRVPSRYFNSKAKNRAARRGGDPGLRRRGRWDLPPRSLQPWRG